MYVYSTLQCWISIVHICASITFNLWNTCTSYSHIDKHTIKWCCLWIGRYGYVAKSGYYFSSYWKFHFCRWACMVYACTLTYTSLNVHVRIQTSLQDSIQGRKRMHNVVPHSCWFQVDLKKLGITDYGDLESGQLGNCANNKLELLFPDRVGSVLSSNSLSSSLTG